MHIKNTYTLRLFMSILAKPNVVHWLCGKTNFLFPEGVSNVIRKERIEREKKWGAHVLGKPIPDKLHWTGPFGEYIGYDLMKNWHGEVWKPQTIQGFNLDWETDHIIMEVKTGAHFVKGSIDEKILGTPFKYVDVPQIYGKPLWVLCVGRCERVCRDVYGNLPGMTQTKSHSKREVLSFFEERGIYFVGATELLLYSNIIPFG